MTEANDVPDWAHDKAQDLWSKDIYAFARYIAAHEQPPVDPDLLIAREAAGQINDEDECFKFAEDYRSGRCDQYDILRSALRAIKLYKEINQ